MRAVETLSLMNRAARQPLSAGVQKDERQSSALGDVENDLEVRVVVARVCVCVVCLALLRARSRGRVCGMGCVSGPARVGGEGVAGREARLAASKVFRRGFVRTDASARVGSAKARERGVRSFFVFLG